MLIFADSSWQAVLGECPLLAPLPPHVVTGKRAPELGKVLESGLIAQT